MGDEAYFLMCGGLYDPIIGLVDAQRSGSDVLSMWASTINKGGKTAPYTIKQSLLRSYMNAWWHNDPDALMVRRNETMERCLRLTYGLLNDEEVKTVTVNQLVGGGIVCSTEPLDKIDTDRLDQLRHILPPMETEITPLEIMQSDRFPDNIRIGYDGKDQILIARINWSDDEPKDVSVTLDRKTLAGLYDPEALYLVAGFYSGNVYANVKSDVTIDHLSSIAPHGAEIIKIERIKQAPIVIRSNAHYSMGLELDLLHSNENTLHIGGRHLFSTPVRYEIAIPQNGRIDVLSSVCINVVKSGKFSAQLSLCAAQDQ